MAIERSDPLAEAGFVSLLVHRLILVGVGGELAPIIVHYGMAQPQAALQLGMGLGDFRRLFIWLFRQRVFR